ncbi:MAG TPA: hypothetical protein PK671_25120, partial [Candidatus Obscuribacter sp.]|nr:hypothetical protein [Candidatus Obscuribacter sp.]
MAKRIFIKVNPRGKYKFSSSNLATCLKKFNHPKDGFNRNLSDWSCYLTRQKGEACTSPPYRTTPCPALVAQNQSGTLPLAQTAL